MPASRRFEPLEFAAPMSRREWIGTALAVIVLLIIALLPMFRREIGGSPPVGGAWRGPDIALPLVGIELVRARASLAR